MTLILTTLKSEIFVEVFNRLVGTTFILAALSRSNVYATVCNINIINALTIVKCVFNMDVECCVVEVRFVVSEKWKKVQQKAEGYFITHTHTNTFNVYT